MEDIKKPQNNHFGGKMDPKKGKFEPSQNLPDNAGVSWLERN